MCMECPPFMSDKLSMEWAGSHTHFGSHMQVELGVDSRPDTRGPLSSSERAWVHSRDIFRWNQLVPRLSTPYDLPTGNGAESRAF